MSGSELYYKDLYKSFLKVRSELKKLAPQFTELYLELYWLWDTQGGKPGLFKVAPHVEDGVFIDGCGENFYITGSHIGFSSHGYRVFFNRNEGVSIYLYNPVTCRYFNTAHINYNVFVNLVNRSTAHHHVGLSIVDFVERFLPYTKEFYTNATKFVDAHWV